MSGKRPMAGGITPNTDHSKVEEILKKNLHLLKNQAGETEIGFNLVEIEESSSQVVAGTMYRVTAKMSHESGDHYRIKMKIWEKSWENFLQITIEDKAKIEK